MLFNKIYICGQSSLRLKDWFRLHFYTAWLNINTRHSKNLAKTKKSCT